MEAGRARADGFADRGREACGQIDSVISIRKNTKDITIPSEEERVQLHPMDFEGVSYIKLLYDSNVNLGWLFGNSEQPQ